MKISELPTMLVERVDDTPTGVRVYGHFDRLEGVRESGKLRIRRGEYVWVDLIIEDRGSCAVSMTDARDPDVSRLRVGERYTWLDDYWQAPLVEAIADESHQWRRFTFKASDAQYFRQGNAIGWQKAGGRIPEGAEALEVRSGGWDHEHCDLCGDHIDADSPIAYEDSDGHFLCETCYARYGAEHDVSFQLGG